LAASTGAGCNVYRYTLKHPAGNLNHLSGAFSTIPSEHRRFERGERSRPSPQASGTAIVEKTERQPKATGLPPLPPPERTEGARGRGGVFTLLDYRLTQGENRKTGKTPFGYVGKSIGSGPMGLLIKTYLNAPYLKI